ncbi:MAG: hypothetical protein RL459_1643 [Pseudomonadota bacterium]|jgi:type IV pilus assembly protein PilE
MTKAKRYTKGFTLIELMVTVAIIAVLAMIALPGYQSYIMKSRRIDAKDALVAVQLAQEKYRGNHTTYATSLGDLGLTANSAQGYYVIALTAPTSSSPSGIAYSATATATGRQTQDTGCQTLVVTQAGFVVDSSAACWGLN